MPRSAISKTEKEDVADSTVAKNATVEKSARVESSEEKIKMNEVATKENVDSNKKAFSVNQNGKVSINSKSRAGKSIIATTGEIITFDKDGNAEVDVRDALYLKNINDFSVK